MPRIRSVHPGLWNDENYVSLSFAARLFLIGILTDADDHGVFEWKPATLKMRLFPADNIDVGPLLEELVEANLVAKREHFGRSFGLIRNFCKWQRPKSPSYRYEFLPEWATYVAFKDGRVGTSRSAPGLPQACHSAGANAMQMEEGEGGDCKEEISWTLARGSDGSNGNNLSVTTGESSTAQTISEAFDEFWSVYPERQGANPKKPAMELFTAAVKNGVSAEMLVDCARAYADDLRKQGKCGTSFVAQGKTWLREERWMESMPKPRDPEHVARDDRFMAGKGFVWSDNRWRPQTEVDHTSSRADA